MGGGARGFFRESHEFQEETEGGSVVIPTRWGGKRVEILEILHGLMGVSGKFTSVKPRESAVYKPQEMYFTTWAFILTSKQSRIREELRNF